MKKKALLLAVLSTGLILGSCGEGGGDSASSSDSSSTDSTRMTALRKFVQGMDANNVTMKVTSTKGSSKRYYFGGDAFISEDPDTGKQGGVLVNGDQGFFYFTIDDGKVNVSSCMGLGNNIMGNYLTPSMLTDDAYLDYIKADGTGLVFEYDVTRMIQDVRYLYYTCSMLGVSGDSDSSTYKYVSSLTLTLNEGGTEGRLSIKVRSGATTITSTATFTNIGTTTNDILASYLANPDTIAAPTDFTDVSKTAITAVFGDYASNIVFPTGLVSAAYSDSPLVQSNQYVGVSWTGYGKNLRNSYGKMLVSAGFEFASSGVSSSDNLTHYYYQIKIEEQNEETREGAHYITADLSYYSTLSEFTVYFYVSADYYRETYDTIAEANEKAIAYINQKADYDIPKLPATDKALLDDKNKVLMLDQTSSQTTYNYILAVGFDFATEEDAKAYLDSYVDLLEATNYVDSENYTYEDDGVLLFLAPSVAKPSAALQLGVYENEETSTYSFELIVFGY